MKFWLKNKLKKILKRLAIKTLSKYRPGIIGITGSVGKTSTKEAVYAVLKNFRQVRANFGNLNNELGLPLTVLGNYQKPSGIFFWLKVILRGYKNLFFSVNYPEILILEYAADHPGDIDYLLSIAQPSIGIVTAIGEIPAHLEFYDNAEAVAKEKSKLLKFLALGGFAVLNFDDEAVLGMKDGSTELTTGGSTELTAGGSTKLTTSGSTQLATGGSTRLTASGSTQLATGGSTRLTASGLHSPIFTYGFKNGAQVRISNFENRNDNGKPLGIIFKLTYGENSALVRMDNAFGKAQAYAAAAAACVGLGFGLNLGRIAEALAYYKALAHRMKFLMGVKETYIIDDSYNASPASMRAAVDTVKSFPAKRRVGILGDMLELGQRSAEAHEAVGVLAAKAFHLLITVGSKAKFIADAAREAGMAETKIISFQTVDEVMAEILGLLKSGDLVLVKGSRAVNLDRLVDEIVYK